MRAPQGWLWGLGNTPEGLRERQALGSALGPSSSGVSFRDWSEGPDPAAAPRVTPLVICGEGSLEALLFARYLGGIVAGGEPIDELVISSAPHPSGRARAVVGHGDRREAVREAVGAVTRSPLVIVDDLKTSGERVELLRAALVAARRPVIWALPKLLLRAPVAGVCCVRILDPKHPQRWRSAPAAQGCEDRSAEDRASRAKLRALCEAEIAKNLRHRQRMYDLYGPIYPGDKRPTAAGE